MSPLRFNQYGLLPPGIHRLNWHGMITLLGFTQARRTLIELGFKPFLRSLKRFAVADVFLNGSFVTHKPSPQDIDGYVPARLGDDLSRFLEETRDAFKREWRVDFYPALTDWDGMGSVEYFDDIFKATSDTPPKLKGYIVLGDWREHV